MRVPGYGCASLIVVVVVPCMTAAVAGWAMWRAAGTRSEAPVQPAVGVTRDALLRPRPMQVADNIFMLGDLFPAAVYVISTSEGLVLVDSGLEAEYDVLTKGMAQLGLDVSQVMMILLTHVHGDHSMGARRLQQQTGAKVFIGAGDAAPLRAGGPWEAIYSKFVMDKATAHPTTVDGELVDGQVFTLGNARMSCIATPGHTPGSFCFLLEMGSMTALFAGDTLMSLSDGMGIYAATLPPRYRGDVALYLDSLRKLGRLAAPDLVLPGHPRSDPFPQRPRLTQAEWDALIGRGIAELTKWSARFAQDGPDFLDGTPCEVADGLFYLGNVEGRACYALEADSRLVLFDPPGGEHAAASIDDAWRRLGMRPPPLAAVFLTSCDADNIFGIADSGRSRGMRSRRLGTRQRHAVAHLPGRNGHCPRF